MKFIDLVTKIAVEGIKDGQRVIIDNQLFFWDDKNKKFYNDKNNSEITLDKLFKFECEII